MDKPLILFDMDGTLIILEDKPTYSGTTTPHSTYMSIKSQMKKIVISFGIPPEEVMDLNRMALIWNKTYRYMEKNGFSEQQIQTVIRDINKPFMVEERAEHEVSVLLPDTITSLETMKNQGYKIGLVTTASRESYDRISRDEKYGCFGTFFKHTVTRDDCRYIKPEPEPIYRILKMYHCQNFIYVGDSDHDAQAAQAAGGQFILINTRGFDEETIASLCPDRVINKLNELPEVLTNLTKEPAARAFKYYPS
jgi:phosphoglycolate phosphatase-like HAD superfamily hydrolase